jgi:hypothetical protein
MEGWDVKAHEANEAMNWLVNWDGVQVVRLVACRETN